MIICFGLRGIEASPGCAVGMMFNTFHNHNQNGSWGGWGAWERNQGIGRPLGLGALYQLAEK